MIWRGSHVPSPPVFPWERPHKYQEVRATGALGVRDTDKDFAEGSCGDRVEGRGASLQKHICEVSCRKASIFKEFLLPGRELTGLGGVKHCSLLGEGTGVVCPEGLCLESGLHCQHF